MSQNDLLLPFILPCFYFRDIDLILNTFDLPEGHINTDTYTQYIEDNTIKLAGLPLSNCSVENGLKDVSSRVAIIINNKLQC